MPASPGQATGIRVFVADDYPLVRRFLASHAAAWGYEVVQAEGGATERERRDHSLMLNRLTRQVRHHGQPIELTNKEFNLLEKLNGAPRLVTLRGSGHRLVAPDARSDEPAS